MGVVAAKRGFCQVDEAVDHPVLSNLPEPFGTMAISPSHNLDCSPPDLGVRQRRDEAVGAFAEKQLGSVTNSLSRAPNVGRILHPSPASPAANKGWAKKATQQLENLDI